MVRLTHKLPIAAALPELGRVLADGTSAVLHAPPGAGKTTVVPLALLDAAWLAGGKVIMLEPRRLAARAAARRMAATLGEGVGETVGYRVRLDSRVGARTRIEVVTEGVLTRMLLADPALEGVGLVILDEFHERGLNADLALALTLQSRELLRPDLRVLVMSATLDGTAVARLLGDAPVVGSSGRVHPVETRWRPVRQGVAVERAVVTVVREALATDEGDLLVFLPGQGEIHRVASLLDAEDLPSGVSVHPLYGALTAEDQDAAIAPSRPGARRVILATSIAETSLTIDGVRVVVDAGLARRPRFSARTGMTRLETVRVSRASADQRRGRAGRTAPGVCYRLWPMEEEAHLPPASPPEIMEADLAPLALELADSGVTDPAELRWLDQPPPAAFARGRTLLAELGALGEDGRITSHGRRMAGLALHPRLAHMILRGIELGHGALAVDIAALLSERDVLRADRDTPDADIRLRLDLLRGPAALGESGYSRGMVVDRDGLRRARELAREWRRRLGIAVAAERDVDAAGLLLALAYPDRIGQRRAGGQGRFLLRAGGGAYLPGSQPLSASPYIVAAELDGRPRESRIFLAAPVSLDDLKEQLEEQLREESVVEWDDERGLVRALGRETLGALVLREWTLTDPDPEAVTAALLGVIRRKGIAALAWDRVSSQLRDRMHFARVLDGDWPAVDDASLLATLELWLAPALVGARRWEDVARVDPHAALSSMLSWRQRAALDEIAPTHWVVPTGSRIAVDYSDPTAPSAAVRLQELFGLAETPRVGGGRVPLTIQLLSPAHRPVQVTSDLAGFWRSSYAEVRKELRGRYPKHHWPEDPLSAAPTRRAKRRE